MQWTSVRGRMGKTNRLKRPMYKEGEQTYEQLRKIQRRYEPKPQVSRRPSWTRQSTNDTWSPSPSLRFPRDSSPVNIHRRMRSNPFASWFARVRGLQSKVSRRSIWDNPNLSPKIRDACAVARKRRYRYIWIDSCCIDKSSSSELSEAINSMYRWYSLADICVAYLADVPPGDNHHADDSCFHRSRWFRRGWTLQELIAPVWLEFLSQDWAPIGSKHVLVSLVESVTDIDYEALLKLKPLDAFSVAQRLSWAAKRETTREEDRAYSLLGIFDIHIPTIYGEGDRAFRRLQEPIMQRIPDQSLFAWGDVYLPGSQLPSSSLPTDDPITVRAQSGFQYSTSPSARSPDNF
ncbi:hypothetical protein GSI_08822 [Ganoderma sinense ZZ0214-1]|uniref:Uncharacterized protein n=1 Tax=Ganoderma sinense ZZ0214-1 TaxID=1077348 RepID=A0A2G8S5F5_9APHY|nr:hypothetical protein GSI_08822 [Ganoderma sinense ZZ0214-1]